MAISHSSQHKGPPKKKPPEDIPDPKPKYDTGWTTTEYSDDYPVPGGVRQGIIQFLKCPRPSCTKTAGYQYPPDASIQGYICFHCRRPFTLEEDVH